MYRRGAKRWNKKFYHLKGHNFVGRRFNKVRFLSYLAVEISQLTSRFFSSRMLFAPIVKTGYGVWDSRVTNVPTVNYSSIKDVLPRLTIGVGKLHHLMKSFDKDLSL